MSFFPPHASLSPLEAPKSRSPQKSPRPNLPPPPRPPSTPELPLKWGEEGQTEKCTNEDTRLPCSLSPPNTTNFPPMFLILLTGGAPRKNLGPSLSRIAQIIKTIFCSTRKLRPQPAKESERKKREILPLAEGRSKSNNTLHLFPSFWGSPLNNARKEIESLLIAENGKGGGEGSPIVTTHFPPLAE